MTITGPTTSASDLTSGTLADARLSSNVPLKDAATNAFTGDIQAPVITLNGSDLETRLDTADNAISAAQSAADNAQSTADTALGNANSASDNLSTHIADTDNPHGVTAEQIGASELGHDHTRDEITDINSWSIAFTGWGSDYDQQAAGLLSLVSTSGFRVANSAPRLLYASSNPAAITFAVSTASLTTVSVSVVYNNSQDVNTKTLNLDYSIDDGVTWTAMTADVALNPNATITGAWSPATAFNGKLKIRFTLDGGSGGSAEGITDLAISATAREFSVLNSLTSNDTFTTSFGSGDFTQDATAVIASSDATGFVVGTSSPRIAAFTGADPASLIFTLPVNRMTALSAFFVFNNSNDGNSRTLQLHYSIDGGSSWISMATDVAAGIADSSISGSFAPSVALTGKVKVRLQVTGGGGSGSAVGISRLTIAIDASSAFLI